MHKMVFINLPVADLPRAKTFYQALGFEVVPAYTNEQAACIKISDTIFAMLLVRPFFQTFTGKTIVDPATQVQALTCLSCDSRAEVDAIVAKALAAAGPRRRRRASIRTCTATGSTIRTAMHGS